MTDTPTQTDPKVLEACKENHRQIDWRWQRMEAGFVGRLAIRIFRQQIQRFAHSCINRAYERGILNNRQWHELAEIINRSLLRPGHQPKKKEGA